MPSSGKLILQEVGDRAPHLVDLVGRQVVHHCPRKSTLNRNWANTAANGRWIWMAPVLSGNHTMAGRLRLLGWCPPPITRPIPPEWHAPARSQHSRLCTSKTEPPIRALLLPSTPRPRPPLSYPACNASALGMPQSTRAFSAIPSCKRHLAQNSAAARRRPCACQLLLFQLTPPPLAPLSPNVLPH